MKLFKTRVKENHLQPAEPTITHQNVINPPVQPPATAQNTPKLAVAPIEKSLHDQRLDIEVQLTDLASTYRQLKSELKLKLADEKAQNQLSLAQVQEELASLEQRQQKLQAQTALLRQESDAVEEQAVANLQSQLDQLQQQHDRQQDHLTSLQRELDSSSEAVRRVILDIDANESESQRLSDLIKSETDLQKMYDLMATQKPAVDKLYQQRERLVSTRTELNDKIASLTTDRDKVAQTVAELIKTSNTTLNLQKRKQHDLSDKISARETTLEQQANRSDRLDHEITAKNQQRVLLEQNITDIQHRIKVLFNTKYLLREVKFDPAKTYYVFTENLQSENKPDILRLLAYLDKRLKKAPVLFTTDYQQRGAQASQDFLTAANLTTIPILNLYQQLQNDAKNTAAAVELPQNENWIQKVDLEHHETSIFDTNQHLLMTVHLNDGDISRIDYFTNNHQVKSNRYNPQGQLSATHSYDEQQQLATIDYFRIDGSIVLTKTFNNQELQSLQLFDNRGLVTKVFATEAELVAWWLYEHLTTNKVDFTLIGNQKLAFYPLLATQLKESALIPVLTNLADNKNQTNALLQQQPYFGQFLVQSKSDWQMLEDLTDRDIQVSVLDEQADRIPKQLTTQD